MDVSLEVVKELVESGLQILNAPQNRLCAQVRWGGVLVRLLKKHHKKLLLKTDWRPIYYTLMRTHFKRLACRLLLHGGAALHTKIVKKISRFVNSNILPGATAEVGLLYCACGHSNLEDSVVSLLKPMLQALTSSLCGTPTYNFGQNYASSSAKASLSPALETAINI